MSSEAGEIKELIKTRGYWEVDIRPDEPRTERFGSITDCMTKVRECRVLLRGWDYPHFSNKIPPYAMQGRIESFTDFGNNKEYWTMFLSGHFYHIFACREDWLKEDNTVFGPNRYSNITPGKVLSFLMTLYSVTEIFEFAIRLAQKKVFGKRTRIKINLYGMEGRKISSFTPRRPIFWEYVCRERNITFDKKMSVEELIGHGQDIALETTNGIFETFNWLDASKDMLREDQRKFLEKRI